MIKFGTGGWRAVIGEDFTKENVEKVAYGIAVWYFKDLKVTGRDKALRLPIAVGYDNRFMSNVAADWLTAKLISYGVPVTQFEESIPTPFLMHTVKHYKMPLGLMVTASHNPYQYNGIKIITAGGFDASKEFTDSLEEIINDKTVRLGARRSGIAKLVRVNSAIDTYLESVFGFVNREAVKTYNKKIIFDPRFGSANKIFMNLCTELGLKVKAINTEENPYFNKKLPAPTPATAADTIETLRKEHAKLGLIFDGDGDRLGVVDDRGRYVSMNKLLCLFFYYCKNYRHLFGGIVKNTVTTIVLDKIADVFESSCITVPVGFKNISSVLSDTDRHIFMGGESSGGVTVSKHIMGKDSIFSAMLLLEILAVTKKPLSKLLEMIDKLYGKTVYLEHTLQYSSKEEVERKETILLESLLKQFPSGLSCDNSDGKKFSVPGSNMWFSIRYSGTEPILRVTWEYYESEEMSQNVRKTVLLLTDFVNMFSKNSV